MITIRKSADRGKTQTDWLESYHTFSFADYDDPKHRNFGHLRVINEDFVQGGNGFPLHPHHDMEIITYVVEGEIAHKDSMGNGSIIKPHEIQKMSAGSGVRHSEYNASKDKLLHLLQIWIMPDQQGITPAYEQKKIPDISNQLILIGSSSGGEHAVKIHQDVNLYVSYLEPKANLAYNLNDQHIAWLQVIKGEVKLNGKILLPGDGAAIKNEKSLVIESAVQSEILLFDLR
jgi:redox-sensitive bicupin YhaK (pirin superfamily)